MSKSPLHQEMDAYVNSTFLFIHVLIFSGEVGLHMGGYAEFFVHGRSGGNFDIQVRPHGALGRLGLRFGIHIMPSMTLCLSYMFIVRASSCESKGRLCNRDFWITLYIVSGDM